MAIAAAHPGLACSAEGSGRGSRELAAIGNAADLRRPGRSPDDHWSFSDRAGPDNSLHRL